MISDVIAVKVNAPASRMQKSMLAKHGDLTLLPLGTLSKLPKFSSKMSYPWRVPLQQIINEALLIFTQTAKSQ